MDSPDADDPIASPGVRLGIRVVLAALGLTAAALLIVLTAVERDPAVLVLVGPLGGEQLELVLWVVLGVVVAVALLLMAWRLSDARTALTSGLAASLYVVIALGGVAGFVVAFWEATWSSSSTYIRVQSDDAEVVVVTTSFLSATYEVYSGSGPLYTRLPGGLDRVGDDPPALTADDFELVRSGGGVALRYPSARGGERLFELRVG
jgi:hypothetical protein